MQKPLSVSDLNELINSVLVGGYNFQQVLVEGEVSGYGTSQNKWVYFDIKDGSSLVNCFMTVWQLKIPLEDGMKVIITGSPKLRPNGRFSYTVKTIEPFGEGAMKRAMELLKAKLEGEGLFALERKRALPKFPSKIGLITGKDTAAYHDFVNTLEKRFGGMEIYFAPVLVQGKDAPGQIVAALNWFSKNKPNLDAIVMTRGGGSLEDLQAFNSEDVVRAVFRSKIPVISGVGHDVDVSLSDLAADLRAKTPTDAAVLLVPDRREVIAGVNHLASRIDDLYGRQIKANGLFLGQAVNYLVSFIAQQEKRFFESLGKLDRDFSYFERAFLEKVGVVRRSGRALITRFVAFADNAANKVEFEMRTLKNLDPKKLLERGYSIVFKDGKVVKSSKQVSKKDKISITLHTGNIQSEVLNAE